ncbi:hypothetical protein G6F58_007497 [Rhizopus delemar]|nr:hypothetical protein G6F58_007497 [Rhizopus delemar]
MKPPPLVTPNSDGTSFITARSKNTNASSVFASYHLSPSHDDKDADEEDSIDYDLLHRDLLGKDDNDNQAKSLIKDNHDTESVATIKPSDIKPTIALTSSLPPALTALSSKIAEPITINKKKRKKHRRRTNKSLLWKKTGSLFVTHGLTDHQPESSIPPAIGETIKRGPVVCMRTVTDRLGSEPTRYKASKESKYSLLTEEWKQVELVLTRSYISTYSLSTLFWPKHRLEYRIYFDGPRKPKNLELFLVSPIDYTFGIRFSSNTGKIPTTIVMTFRAKSFLQCQEWYMQLYKLLPSDAKSPFPSYCEVYIPMLDLILNLPLEKTEGCYDVTLADVKEAVIAVVEEGGYEGKLSCLDDDELGLCWATKERAEWVHWTYSSDNPNQRIDWAICPQSIEQTHRLELRIIEHSPYDILLEEGATLREPPSVEGFLECTSNFFGLKAKISKRALYFASFDQYLFYIPSLKAAEPDAACRLDEEWVPENLRTISHASLISPYAEHATKEVELQEMHRRMKLLTEAKGLIDLTEVSYVRRRFIDLSEDEQVTYDSQTSQDHMLGRSGTRNSSSCTLELVMDNGLNIQFETFSMSTCDVWVNYLSQLVVYWKARKEAKREAHLNDRFTNSLMNEQEKGMGGACRHDKEKKLADTRVWSYCLYEQCRDIVKSGILYYKPHHRGTYSKKFFILAANGWLYSFDVFNRNSESKSGNHHRKGAIDTAGCYFYSGVDCSKKKKGTNMTEINEKMVKVYSSGLATDDAILACIFSIWKPKLRKYYSPRQHRLRVYGQDQRLNSNGQTITFLAESRQEKEEWIHALNSVAEHMMRKASNE